MHHKQSHHIFSIILSIFLAVQVCAFIWVEYRSPDAQYMRDNALYLENQMYNVGILKDKPSPFSYYIAPLPINMKHLLTITELWTSGYVESAIKSNNSNINATPISGNPYNALSHLELKANKDTTQTIYNDVSYCASVCAPDYPLTKSSLDIWNSNRDSYIEAIKSCRDEAQAYFVHIIFLSINFTLLLWTSFHCLSRKSIEKSHSSK